MLDERDLQSIAQLLAQQKSEIKTELMHEMDARLARQKSEITHEMDAQLARQKSEIMHEVNILMESYFDPKFNYLAESLDLLKEKVVSREETEETSDRLDVLEAVVKIHGREIEKLKKAQ